MIGADHPQHRVDCRRRRELPNSCRVLLAFYEQTIGAAVRPEQQSVKGLREPGGRAIYALLGERARMDARDEEVAHLRELAEIARPDARWAKNATGRDYLLMLATRLEERAAELEMRQSHNKTE